MKAKQLLATAALLIAGLSANAQAFKCEQGFKEFLDKANAKQYDGAYKLLAPLQKNCGKYDAKLYSAAEKVLNYRIETAVKDTDKKTAVQDLVNLYNEQQKNFPGTGGEVKKTALLHKNGQLTDEKAFDALYAQFMANKSQFTSYEVIELFFKLYLKNYETAKIDKSAFVTNYIDLYSQATTALYAVNAKRAELAEKEAKGTLTIDDKAYLTDTKYDAEGLRGVMDNMSKVGAKYFSCDKLQEFYTAGYKQNSEDMNWIAGMVNMLSSNKCYQSDLLFTGATLLYGQAPSYDNTYRMGYLSQKKGDAAKAAEYYVKAADLQQDDIKKSELYMMVAGIYNDINKSEAKKYVLKAAVNNPANGQPYIMLAEMYASVTPECGLTDFEKKAILYLAINTVKKAEVADAKYKPTVEAMIKEYSKNLPAKKDAKAAKKSKGDTIAFGCWINESVVLPKLQ